MQSGALARPRTVVAAPGAPVGRQERIGNNCSLALEALTGRMPSRPAPHPREFREGVVAVARSHESGVTINQITTDVGISQATLQNWLRQADVDDGNDPGQRAAEAAEARELKKRIRLLRRTSSSPGMVRDHNRTDPHRHRGGRHQDARPRAHPAQGAHRPVAHRLRGPFAHRGRAPPRQITRPRRMSHDDRGDHLG